MAELNDLKLKIKAIEKSEKQLLDTMLAGGFNDDLLTLANQKATQFKNDKQALYERIEELGNRKDERMVWNQGYFRTSVFVKVIKI